MEDQQLRVDDIAEIVGISHEHVYHILTKELGMKKLCARWVPHLLSSDQKAMRTKVSEKRLERFMKK